ncbi:hypothetical protein SAMN03159473_05739, partial [Pseudomonas sp. NFACC52]
MQFRRIIQHLAYRRTQKGDRFIFPTQLSAASGKTFWAYKNPLSVEAFSVAEHLKINLSPFSAIATATRQSSEDALLKDAVNAFKARAQLATE